MPSTLGYGLLGLLARRPRTGYALTQALRDPIGYFWTASHSQVYPQLAALEADGLVRHRVVDGPGPRDTKTYRITASGRRALAEWAATPLGPQVERDEFMLKVYSLWIVEPSTAADMIRTQRDRHIDRLSDYRLIEAEFHAGSASELADPRAPEFAAYATLRRGISYEKHALDWCEWLLDRLGADA